MDLQSIDYLSVINDSSFKPHSANDGGEFAGACPFCGGNDRFIVHPTPRDGNPRAWCRQCGFKGDVIAFVQRRDNVDFKAALSILGLSSNGTAQRTARRERTAPKPQPIATVNTDAPCFHPDWQTAARKFVSGAKDYLWSERGTPALNYLRNRGFSDDLLRAHDIGFNPLERSNPKPRWGDVEVWLPMGIVLGWSIDDQIWNVRTRRLNPDCTSFKGKNKYVNSTGMANGIWGIDRVTPNSIVVMTEGEFNALSIEATARAYRLPLVGIAAGSTTNGRRQRWVMRLLSARRVYVAFDQDENGAGETASQYWLKTLGDTAARLRPPTGINDVNELLQKEGVDGVARWLFANCPEIKPPAARKVLSLPASYVNVTERELKGIGIQRDLSTSEPYFTRPDPVPCLYEDPEAIARTEAAIQIAISAGVM